MRNSIFVSEDNKSAFHIADILCVDGNDVYIASGSYDYIVLTFTEADTRRIIHMMKEYHDPVLEYTACTELK